MPDPHRATSQTGLTGTYAILSVANGESVTAEVDDTGNNYGMLRARSATIGPWETSN
ncbi:hypothetical protein GA0115240_140649 [Streptomyces sp. DvalAA-14]|uniref:hypothetical protein n=1 Tax=unclassified Streptomyces TaxID=2593676 RepID=UPI00081B07D9|nr:MULTISPECIES: hypothetical protein [unclassified Streptomyces]MYS22369.1 hypothetical protein [Streptomyces sp. SID4948]SCE14711.1 hypothetical protein GA0115240_140649 [Streptomyces sp. DvalAA-14]